MIKILASIAIWIALVGAIAMTPSQQLESLQHRQFDQVVSRDGPSRARRLWLADIRAYKALVRNVPQGDPSAASYQGGVGDMGVGVGNVFARATTAMARWTRKEIYTGVFFVWPRAAALLSWVLVAAVFLFAATVADGIFVRRQRQHEWRAAITSPTRVGAARWLIWLGAVAIAVGVVGPWWVEQVSWIVLGGWVLANLGVVLRVAQLPRMI